MFCGGRKNKEPRGKPSDQGWDLTNSTHIPQSWEGSEHHPSFPDLILPWDVRLNSVLILLNIYIFAEYYKNPIEKKEIRNTVSEDDIVDESIFAGGAKSSSTVS